MDIKFVPGCFDGFEGTQEELDELVEEITKLAKEGKLEVMYEIDNEELLENLNTKDRILQ